MRKTKQDILGELRSIYIDSADNDNRNDGLFITWEDLQRIKELVGEAYEGQDNVYNKRNKDVVI